MVQNAQASKAPAQRLADTAGKYLVFVALGAGVLTLLAWLLAGRDLAFAVTVAVSAVVIACPDALALATPTAITVGVGRGAHTGVLFKNATALEATAGVDLVVFDKTGTLTEGRPALSDLRPATGADSTELLRLAATADQPSQHPLAEAVAAAIRLARAVRRKIKQNLFWAAIYNLLAIPVAAGVLYPSLGLLLRPEWSALLMSASTVIVTVNALLLRRTRLTPPAAN